MEQRYLLDTNIVIYLLHGNLNKSASTFLEPILHDKPNISLITKIELLSWEADLAMSQQFVDSSNILPLEDKIVNICIDIRRKHRMKVPDALIAATSIGYNLELLTRNTADFKKINELNWRNPFEL